MRIAVGFYVESNLKIVRKLRIMSFLDSLRQLYLLLWKNFVVRRRHKLRIVIEIVWPTFLFFILVLVRLRELTKNEPNCKFFFVLSWDYSFFKYLSTIIPNMSLKIFCHQPKNKYRPPK